MALMLLRLNIYAARPAMALRISILDTGYWVLRLPAVFAGNFHCHVAVITGVADTNTDADTRPDTDIESVMTVALNCTRLHSKK